jgi:TP901 family phage tail tape measure protein
MTREVEARLKISARDATGRTFGAIAGKLGEIDKRAEAFNRRQSVMARQAQETFGIISRYAAPAVLGYAATGALKDFAALERQMTRIGNTAGASGEEVERAWAGAQQVARDLNYESVQPAIEALDTLVASGQSLEEAMAFLPSVLATAQASGAATADIANTGLKAASALKIETSELQRAFDIMVTGGKAGQFELKDMAREIPTLANSFATLGYKGEEGLKQLVAILQTIREDSGSSAQAATQAQNIFAKMFSQETEKNFADFGVNVRQEVDAAIKAGEGAIDAYVRIARRVLQENPTARIGDLFVDQEFQLGMQSLMTSGESMQKFLDVMNSTEVDGSVFRDLNRVMSDTQASIDRMSNSWDRLKNSFGSAAAPLATDAMDAVSKSLDYHGSVNAGLEKSGVKGFWERTKFGLSSSDDEKMRMAIIGGYKDRADVADYYLRQYEGGTVKASVGRHSSGVAMPRAPAAAPAVAQMGQDFFRAPSEQEVKDAFKIDLGFKREGEQAGQAVADGGKQAGEEIEKSAAFIKIAGYEVSTAIANAAKDLMQAAGAINRMPMGAPAGGGTGVNANTGRSMPATASRPAGTGRQ